MTPSDVKTLFKAIEANQVGAVTALLDAEPSAIDVSGDGAALYRDKTPLMYALQCNHFELARLLLARGANASARMRGGPGSSVISLAVRFVIAGRSQEAMLDIVGTLLDAGANPSDALWPALSAYNKAFDQIEMIALLLDRGADPDVLVGNTGNTVRELLKVNARLYSQRVHALFRERPSPGAP